ncbi:MAG TPA: hypothetical protein VJC18_02055 [bacterium]|nr:hypothetical protein [bacterium]
MLYIRRDKNIGSNIYLEIDPGITLKLRKQSTTGQERIVNIESKRVKYERDIRFYHPGIDTQRLPLCPVSVEWIDEGGETGFYLLSFSEPAYFYVWKGGHQELRQPTMLDVYPDGRLRYHLQDGTTCD